MPRRRSTKKKGLPKTKNLTARSTPKNHAVSPKLLHLKQPKANEPGVNKPGWLKTPNGGYCVYVRGRAKKRA